MTKQDDAARDAERPEPRAQSPEPRAQSPFQGPACEDPWLAIRDALQARWLRTHWAFDEDVVQDTLVRLLVRAHQQGAPLPVGEAIALGSKILGDTVKNAIKRKKQAMLGDAAEEVAAPIASDAPDTDPLLAALLADTELCRLLGTKAVVLLTLLIRGVRGNHRIAEVLESSAASIRTRRKRITEILDAALRRCEGRSGESGGE